MPFHTFAYTKLDTAAAVNEDITALTDNFLTIQNGHFISQTDLTLLAAWGSDPGILNARINTPHFRAVSIPSIQPVEASTTPTSPPSFDWMQPSKLTIPAIDEIAFEISNGGAGGVRATGIVWAGLPGFTLNVPAGDTFKLRATGVITAVANTWTPGAITFDQTLPQGNYAVIGMEIVGANLQAARLVFQGIGPRPGCLARTAVSQKNWLETFARGSLGVWGTFPNTAQPNIEILAAAANVAQTVFLDVIRIGGNPFAP